MYDSNFIAVLSLLIFVIDKYYYILLDENYFNFEDTHRAGRPNEIEQDLINSELDDNPVFSSVMLAEKLGFGDHAIRNQLHAMGPVYKL